MIQNGSGNGQKGEITYSLMWAHILAEVFLVIDFTF